ncbi:complement factor D isoform X1 [Salvelinus sp. IW2-2015]|uniref:complement factor D isoform X1 n=1 Tax=Salvelinus sp. IW2-2015 TaxID=2691554 RepID=UPI000CDF9533|nr:complement factor D isoform X1 [Salvelinus alpinus]
MAIRSVVLHIVLIIALNGTEGRKVPKVSIVGGREAARNSRPYMASLQSRGQHSCGGVLVREDFVLTAAHCDGRYRVVLGAHDLSEDENSQQKFDVVKYIPHPRFGDNLGYDIMLLKLRGRAILNRAVQLIPLMNGSMAEGSLCTTAGWGDIDDNSTPPDKLQEVNATIISPRECGRRWSGVNISRRTVCATGPRAFQGFCSGDSGGPLVCNGMSAGIVSFSGQRCANPSTPDVYTRVTSYCRWIQRELARNP